MTANAASRADYIRGLPTLAEAAALIDLDPSGVSRAVKKLRIEPLPWGTARSTWR